MRIFHAPPRGRPSLPQTPELLSSYLIGRRTVDFVQLADGSTRWVCNCDDYQAAAGCAQGAWCKHVAKAAAIRSIERLTGERVVRTIARPPQLRVPVGPLRPEAARPAASEPGIRQVSTDAGQAVGLLQ